MPDQPYSLSPQQLDTLNAFLNANTSDGALTCPLTGERVPITEWNAPARVLMLGGNDGEPYAAVPLTSPAGGVILLSAVKSGLLPG